KNELRDIIEEAVSFVNEAYLEILPEFEISYKTVCSLHDIGVVKISKKMPLDSNQIADNIKKLKGKLKQNKKSSLCQELFLSLRNVDILALIWKDFLANQIISNNSILVQQLMPQSQEDFMELKRKMTPHLPHQKYEESVVKSEKQLAEVTDRILDTLKDTWNNPVFSPEFAGFLSEGTYVNNIILPAIRAVLKGLPLEKSTFVSSSELQSSASADRRAQKEQYDAVKLWRELGTTIRLNVLIRDSADVHRYYHLRDAKIPIRQSNSIIVANFIEVLLILRNILVVNIDLLYNALIPRTPRKVEDSSIVSSPRREGEQKRTRKVNDELETRVSDSLLRELNSRLVTEIDKLRREKDSLISKNTELLARIVELEQTIKEDAKNTKLRDAELNTRIFELERSAKENEELRNRVAKLEQNQCIDTNTKSLDDETNSNNTSEQIISCNEKSNTSNSDIYQDSVTPTSPAETISFDSQSDLRRLEEKVENEFLDSKYRERIRKEIIQNIKKKKLWDQELFSTPENTIPKISIPPNKNVSIPEAKKSLLNKDLNIQDTKLSSSESKSFIISSSNQEQSNIFPKLKFPIIKKLNKLFSEKTECQKVIGVKNLHAHITEPSSSNNIEVNASPKEKEYQVLSVKINNPENRKNSKNNTLNLFPLKKMLSKEKRKEVINKLTTHFTDSSKLDLYFSINKKGEHQSDAYWVLSSHCPLCRENHTRISFDEVLEAYPENSKLIQELKTYCFTLPIPWNNALKFLNKSIA
ncbi:22292_t:CDS:2, partial [Gigaspora margarita]